MSDEEIKQKVWEQIAHLAILGIGSGQIASTLDIKESDLIEIMKEEGYNKELEKLRAEKMQRAGEFDSSVDDAEAQALQIINTNLKVNRDPMFALQVFNVMNKAKRRQVGFTIQGQQGMRANIALPVQFVQMMQQNNFVLEHKTAEERAKPLPKVIDMMQPRQVETVLRKAGGNSIKALMDEIMEAAE